MKVSPNKIVLETRRKAKLKQIAKIGPFVAASLVKIHRPCGNKNCHCAKGKGHPAHLLTFKKKGKTQSVYVPVDLVDEVMKWVINHKILKARIQDVSNLSIGLIQKHVTLRRAAAKRKGLKSQT